MAEIIADLRDDLVAAFREHWCPHEANQCADIALETIKRWCAKEPVNDN
jgi:hypothetical protein